MKQSKNKLSLHITQIVMLLASVIVLALPTFQTKRIIFEALLAQILITTTLFIKTYTIIRPKTNNLSNFDNQDLLSSDTVLDSLSDGVAIIDNSHAIKFFNKSATIITGFQPEEALGINHELILKLSNAQNSLLISETNPITAAHKSYINNRIDLLYLQTKGQKNKPISMQITPISDKSSDILVVFRDISRELDKEREQLEFISTASHEMRTPIATINGYLGLALNPKISQVDDKAREYILKAQSAVEHLGELFKNLLSITKAEDQQIQINPQVLNLTTFGREICADFQSQAITKNLQLIFQPDNIRSKTLQPDILVHTDKNLLYEVVSNLIENALKYTHHGTIAVNVDIAEQDLAIITVTDTGIGIPSEDIPHLFQKFYRVDNSQTREIGGTGLGLYLCRKIIETLHGRIWVESAVNQGSTFFIELKRISKPLANQLQANDELQQAANQKIFIDHRPKNQ